MLSKEKESYLNCGAGIDLKKMSKMKHCFTDKKINKFFNNVLPDKVHAALSKLLIKWIIIRDRDGKTFRVNYKFTKTKIFHTQFFNQFIESKNQTIPSRKWLFCLLYPPQISIVISISI